MLKMNKYLENHIYKYSGEYNALLNNSWVKREIWKKIEKHIELNESENIISKFVGCSQSSIKREMYTAKCLY